MKPYRVRTGSADDLAWLAAIERDGAQRYRKIGYDFCADGPVRDGWEHERALTDGVILIGEDSTGERVAFALVWRLDGSAHLLELSVMHRCQRAGLGRSLIEAVESWAERDGLAEVTLTTFRDVSWNAPFFERLGYRTFTPETWRTGLAAVQAEEAAAGFAVKPRIAMRKALPGHDRRAAPTSSA